MKDIGDCIIAKENYDLLDLVVIRLGDRVYNGGIFFTARYSRGEQILVEAMV